VNIYEQYKDHIAYALKAVSDEGYEVLRHDIVGSTYIADNHESDLDILVLVKKWEDVSCMCFDGWAYGGSVGEGDDDKWGSWKKFYNGKDVNLLVTDSQEYFSNWLLAAEVCRFVSLMSKDIEPSLRLGIHNIIMDDSDASLEAKESFRKRGVIDFSYLKDIV
jgi:hypothetical protein